MLHRGRGKGAVGIERGEEVGQVTPK